MFIFSICHKNDNQASTTDLYSTMQNSHRLESTCNLGLMRHVQMSPLIGYYGAGDVFVNTEVKWPRRNRVDTGLCVVTKLR